MFVILEGQTNECRALLLRDCFHGASGCADLEVTRINNWKTKLELQAKSQPFVHSSGLSWDEISEGTRRMILGYSPEIMMVRVEFKTGAVGYIHTHPHRQVTYVDSGRFEVQIDGKKEILESGDSFIVEPHIPHGVIALEDGCLIDVFSPALEDFLDGKSR